MNDDFEYIVDQSLLIHHVANLSVFDEISYLLTIKELVTKVNEVKPKLLMILITSKKIFNYEIIFSHWIETEVFSAFDAAGLKKVAFVLTQYSKTYKFPEYTTAPGFNYSFFRDQEKAKEWLVA